MKYVIGVDGGGTKTHCALFDIEGNNISLTSWGPTNHEVLKDGFDGLEKSLSGIIDNILNAKGLQKNDLVKCVFGLAGVDTKNQHIMISNIVKRIGIKDFILCNDSFLGIKAGCEAGLGISIVNGTGCTVSVKDLNKIIFMAADMGNKQAIDILRKTGSDIAKSVNSIITELCFDDEICIVLNGSINVQCENQTAIDLMKEDVIAKKSR